MDAEALEQAREKTRLFEQSRGWSRGYPETTMLEPSFVPADAVKQALMVHRRERRPFRLVEDQWLAATKALYADLSQVHELPTPKLRHVGAYDGCSGASRYSLEQHAVTLFGRESVMTALHEFAHAMGFGETGAVWWSVNHFAATWPRSYGRLQTEPGSHVVRLPGRAA